MRLIAYFNPFCIPPTQSNDQAAKYLLGYRGTTCKAGLGSFADELQFQKMGF